MAKEKTVFVCTNCGQESPKWIGKCPSCGAWNTFVEEIVRKEQAVSRATFTASADTARRNRPVPLSNIEGSEELRMDMGDDELNRVLGGGLVPGSLVLLGGEPGIGKSTLVLQTVLRMPERKILYVSGEESARQLKLRADRIQHNSSDCLIVCETSLEQIFTHIRNVQPELVVIDSIQTISTELIESSPGSVSQVRECAASILKYAKETNTPVILIGHINKEGSIAGPKVLEHIVDVVLQFEGDDSGAYRILRGIKNRFGATSEIAVYEMTSGGLKEVANPSDLLIPMHEEALSGIAVSAMLDGTRPLLIETQALVGSAAYGTPQRSATGFDVRRMNMLLAVLEKRAGFRLGTKDVFLNMAGGLRVNDPACDLAVISAVLSSNFDLPVSSHTCFCGEVGLSGEIRPVSQTERMIAEASKIGFDRIFISGFTSLPEQFSHKGIEVVKISDVPQLCRALFK